MRRLPAICLLFIFLITASRASAQTVFDRAGDEASLASRVESALADAAQRGFEQYWIVYSVERRMRRNSWMGNLRGDGRQERTLSEVLTGVVPERGEPQSLKDTARRALDDMEGRSSDRDDELVTKRIAVLILMRRGEPTDVDLSNLDLSFQFDGHPVFWLGPVDDAQSIAYLRFLYDCGPEDDAREDLVGAIGMHDSFSLVRPFLVDVLDSRTSNDVREAAVFWLHKDDTRETRMYLVRLAERDASVDVREQAVFALNLMKSDEALDRLIALARTADDEDVREKARFWLGQKASNIIAAAADESPASEIQKQAVFALAQMDDDGGVDELIRLVHEGKSPVIRKQALFWLGQTDDNRALDLIVSILRPGS